MAHVHICTAQPWGLAHHCLLLCGPAYVPARRQDYNDYQMALKVRVVVVVVMGWQ